MLGDNPIDVILLATDLKASTVFYSEQIGLEILSESERCHVSMRRRKPPDGVSEHHRHG